VGMAPVEMPTPPLDLGGLYFCAKKMAMPKIF